MQVMLIDDDPLDAETVRRVLQGLAGGPVLETMPTADQALVALRGRCAQMPVPVERLPDLNLLDLNLPGMTGQEFLAALNSDVRFRSTPVVVLTTSGLPQDVRSCFDRGASGYFVKPLEYARFADLLTRIINYWNVCETPQRPSLISR